MLLNLTNLEIILIICLYICLSIISYIPFKKIAKKDWTHKVVSQSILFPFMWVILLIVWCYLGAEMYFTKNREEVNKFKNYM